MDRIMRIHWRTLQPKAQVESAIGGLGTADWCVS
jgi:hypothetical protein